MMKLFNFSVVRYGIVGGIGTLIHFLVLLLLVRAYSLSPILASAIGFMVVLLLSYQLNKYWTFNQINTVDKSSRFIKYTVVSGCGLILNTSVMYVSIEWLHLNYVIGQALVIVVVPIFNYILNRNWTFRALPDA